MNFMLSCIFFLFSFNSFCHAQESDITFHIASADNDNNLLDILQKYGTNPQKPALNNALEANDINSVIILLEYGVDVNKRGPRGSITQYGHKANLELSNEGQTALEIAIEKNLISIIPLLLEKGANPYSSRKLQYKPYIALDGKPAGVQDYKDTTAISDAIDADNLEIIILLHSCNINFSCVCIGNGYFPVPYTPLQYAVSFKHYDIANFLLSIGASFDA